MDLLKNCRACSRLLLEVGQGWRPGRWRLNRKDSPMKKLLSGVAVAALVLVAAHPALAGGQVSDSIKNVGQNISTTPILINYASYIIGAALGVSGISKLKAHVDNPGQTAIKDGLGRVAAAAMFISLPFVLNMLRDTSSMGTSTNSYISISTPTQF